MPSLWCPGDGNPRPLLLHGGKSWSFVREALRPDWEALDQAGRKRRFFWLVFVLPIWTVWTMQNKIPPLGGLFSYFISDFFGYV